MSVCASGHQKKDEWIVEDVRDLDIQSLFHSDKIEQTYIGSVQRAKVVANANRVRRLFLIRLPESVCVC